MIELQIFLLKAYSVRTVLDRASRDKSADKRTGVRILESHGKMLLVEKSTFLSVWMLRKPQKTLKWVPDSAICGSKTSWAAISRRCDV